MQKILYIIAAVLLMAFPDIHVHAQKVGLVLSGGGAKGITHIGIIRALEENDIPIDYIAGTSMGAIIGSLYAMGYSPDDMERLIKSDDFKRWYTGQMEEKYIYYFKKDPPTPEFINIRISLLGSSPRKVKTQFLPLSVVDPLQMNIAFLELFGEATAACGGDFDNLFVPFRCVASDVYDKRPIILRSGDLSDAVRASMTFPAMFKPIEIDSVLAYDGGIYNNFPVNVMVDDFHPDIIIGSVVSSNPRKPKEDDLLGQLENMIMQKTDYALPDSLGILMKFKYTDVGLMDFDRYDELHETGYNKAIGLMDSIKCRISSRSDHSRLEERRTAFKNGMPKFRFREITVHGVSEQQIHYIRKEFHADEDGTFSLEEFRKGYFRLMSDNIISEIIPHAIYNPNDKEYTLDLKVKMEENFSLSVGGNVGSNGSNHLYVGATYHNLNNFAKEFSIDGQVGQIYNGLQVSGRIDLPTLLPTSYRLVASLSSYNYLKQEKLWSKGNTPVFNKQKERFVKFFVSLPFLSNMKAEFGIGVTEIEDQYFQTNIIDFSSSVRDQSKYMIFGGSVAMDGNTLNSRQFATSGRRERLSAHIYTGSEKYYPGTDQTTYDDEDYKYIQSWIKFSYEIEKYFNFKHNFTLGTYMNIYYSSRNFSHNYRATMMQAGEFSPTAHSKIAYNEAFRANQYVGLGIVPIYQFSNVIHARLGVYGFLPMFPIKEDSNHKAYFGNLFTRQEWLSELDIVVGLPFGAISAYVNYYSSPKNNWNIGLTLGWQIFGNRFMD